jgi:hypothetical protein
MGAARRSVGASEKTREAPSWGAARHPCITSDPMTQEASREQDPVGPSAGGRDQFIDSLMDTELYSIGAFFCDEHPDLVDEVVERSVEIERRGLEAYARAGDSGLEETFETLLTGLAVRYYKAVAG